MTEPKNPEEETPAEFLARVGTDATKWAQAFCYAWGDHIDEEVIDEGLMVAWFTNAIEAGRDEGIKAMQEPASGGWCSPSP